MASKIKSTNINMKFTLFEKFDRFNLAKLLANENPEIIDDEYKCRIHKYKNYSNKGMVQVEYENTGIGRLKWVVKKLKKDSELTYDDLNKMIQPTEKQIRRQKMIEQGPL